MASKSKNLRSGYTTGACAAAAAKAALLFLVGNGTGASYAEMEIPFPGGARHRLRIEKVWGDEQGGAGAAVIKDAGDDPDITDGAEIVARVVMKPVDGGDHDTGGTGIPKVVIEGGAGVGRVTHPGLPVPIGEAAINPVPRRMIAEAVAEALREARRLQDRYGEVKVTISVPQGEALARKTLNSRLGIVGGISILGTTGIVRPISSEAWTATITTSMNVAEAMGRKEIVLSSGRTSERAHMERYGLPEETYVMMGDYVEFALLETRRHRFTRIHLNAQWAKMLKTAMATPQTHVRHGAIDLEKVVAFLTARGWDDARKKEFATAREMLGAIKGMPEKVCRRLLARVCKAAREFAESITGGVPVSVHLVSYEGEIIAHG